MILLHLGQNDSVANSRVTRPISVISESLKTASTFPDLPSFRFARLYFKVYTHAQLHALLVHSIYYFTFDPCNIINLHPFL